MAGALEESIVDLFLPSTLDTELLRAIAQKLNSSQLSVPGLLELNDEYLDQFLSEGLRTDWKFGVRGAISVRKRALEKERLTSGKSPSKRSKVTDSMVSYFERLLKPPEKLPEGDDLENFLSMVPFKLPLLTEKIYDQIFDKDLVTLKRSGETDQLAGHIECIVNTLDRSGSDHPGGEADSSADLRLATGDFLRYLDSFAPRSRQLRRLGGCLDSSNRTTFKGSSKPLLPFRRPDFQLYVSDCLILRWENKSNFGDMSAARQENISKLKKWSPLYYGELPYVIGGACAGRMFSWLRLFSTGESLDYRVISPVYDLTKAGGVVALLQSTVRMHCLLQKLQEKLDGYTSPRLYEPIQSPNGSTVTFYPEVVVKVVDLSEERVAQLRSLYEAVHDSFYVIHQKLIRTTRGRTTMWLYPVGYRAATPRDLKEVKDAAHDILHGLVDLHSAGFAHRDIRWENIVKVLIEDKWKYILIDLEESGPDKEEWKKEKLRAWDAATLDKGEKYTSKSDLYQFGKLLIEWVRTCPYGNKDEIDQVMKWGSKLEKKRTTAANMLKGICNEGCKRCLTFARAGNSPPLLEV